MSMIILMIKITINYFSHTLSNQINTRDILKLSLEEFDSYFYISENKREKNTAFEFVYCTNERVDDKCKQCYYIYIY